MVTLSDYPSEEPVESYFEDAGDNQPNSFDVLHISDPPGGIESGESKLL